MATRLRGLLPGIIIVAATALVTALGLLAPAERLLGDLRTRVLMAPVDSNVLIVGIDAHSLRTLNRWPWRRDLHAELLERLHAAGPDAVFLDIDFSAPSGDPNADAALARALARPRAYPIVLPAFWQSFTTGDGVTRVLTEPPPALAEHTRVGLVNVYPGDDGLVRTAVHRDQFGTRDYPSASATLANRGDFAPGVALPIDFRIATESFSYASYADLLAGRVPSDSMQGRIVMVGATALELGDNVPVPIHRSMAGVTLQALAYETLRHGVPLVLPWQLSVLLAVILVVGWWSIQQRGWRLQLLLGSAAALSILALSLYLHGVHDLLLGVTAPLLALLACLVVGTMLNADHQNVSAMLAGVSLKRQEALVSGIFGASIDGILVLTTDGRIVDANPSAARLFSTRADALRGRPIRAFLPALRTTGADGLALSAGRFEVQALTADGEIPVEVSVSPVTDDSRGLMTAIVRDVSERRRQQAVLRHQATHDPLTKLPNRTLLNSQLEELPHDSRAALFMLDLDGFKQVNDTLGHGVGDQVLRALGKRLRGSLPEEVKIFRIGGDEFAVLVSSYETREELLGLAEQLIDRVRAPVTAGKNHLELGGSVGIALHPEHASSGTALLQCADIAMYTAKAGRGHTAFYDATRDHSTLRNLKIASRLRTAIEAEELSVVYQPKLDLTTNRCCGVEALIRWRDSELGQVSPAEFIPLAEASDLIDQLTRFTVARAVYDQARWCARGIDVGVAVNLSARHLTDAEFTGQLVDIVRRSGLETSKMELEITETALMDDPERARAVLAGLTDEGIRLAIDDFGTGFSSLAYLKHLNLHTLKIDRCFIEDLERSVADRKIVASTLSMAHSLDLSVVAEGIETPGQARILKELGCELGQGYGLARPMTADAFIDWYRKPMTGSSGLHSVPA